MSYAGAAALQAAIFQTLSASSGLAGVPIHDSIPPGGETGTFVLVGPEEARDASDKSGGGAEHRLVISVISDASGFQAAKAIAVAISDALIGAPLTLTRGRLVSLLFATAKAVRVDEGAVRRIDLTFRARVEV